MGTSPTSGMLDRMPDTELIGHTLDLGRPELAGLMRRYMSDFPRPKTSMLGPPAALFVPGGTGEELPVPKALESGGVVRKDVPVPGQAPAPCCGANDASRARRLMQRSFSTRASRPRVTTLPSYPAEFTESTTW
jgi:hypothetical protein